MKLYEESDKARCAAVMVAKKKCRNLRTGQVAFSPTVKLLMSQIKAWKLLLKRNAGGKVSLQFLERSLKKAGLCAQEKTMSKMYFEEKLKETYQLYETAKGNAAFLCSNYLHMLAEARSEKKNTTKEKIYRNLLRVERQIDTARKVRQIRGKMQSGSTSMVHVQDEEGRWKHLTEKTAIEEAIMVGTQKKCTASLGTPFMTSPLTLDMGYQGKG